VNERSERVARAFEYPVLVAALLVIPVILIEGSSLGHPWSTIAGVLNWLIWLVFAAELVAMLAVVPNRREWLRRHPLEVIVVVLTPPFLPASLQAMRVLRLLRLVRLFRLAQILRRSFSAQGVRAGALLAVLTALGGGATFAALEERQSTWDGVWWAVTTMTTVGYGDVLPDTNAGRVLGILVMLIGIGLVALVSGAVAERFLRGNVDEKAPPTPRAASEGIGPDAVAELREIRFRLEQLEARLAGQK
jgi:voltage-gated potassium channel